METTSFHLQQKTGAVDPNKVTLLPGHTEDLSAVTYCLNGEDHTIGNLLRHMLMQNPDVEFCGYSAPHPSEDKIHLRIQMYDGKSGREALLLALDQLEEMITKTVETYDEALGREDEYEVVEDDKFDFESANDRIWAKKEAEGRGSRAEYEAQRQQQQQQDSKPAVTPMDTDGTAKKSKGKAKSKAK